MYTLSTPLGAVMGIGDVLRAKLYDQHIRTVLDLLLSVPLRYEDRSDFRAIEDLEIDSLATIKATVISVSSFYKNRRTITNAVVADDTDRLKLVWFNNKFVKSSLKVDSEYFFSGKLSKYKTMTQPTFEALKQEAIHTNRLVPLYTTTLDFKQGTLRRILKHICDELSPEDDSVAELSAAAGFPLPDLGTTFKQLHFPDEEEAVARSRERLALEELLTLIKRSQSIKSVWEKGTPAVVLEVSEDSNVIPKTIPFELTASQLRSSREILSDLRETVPMNRLLIGDVGSGKTIVAALALRVCVQNNTVGCLVAPTQILAEQHAHTIRKFFPELPLLYITGKGIQTWEDNAWQKIRAVPDDMKGCVVVGTHAVLNAIQSGKIPAPVSLIVYDEQHRFGVKQRAIATSLTPRPHVLTMTATPIPRSLMLTIFSHLHVSSIDELPKDRIPTKTWVLPESKRSDMLAWLQEQMGVGERGSFLTLVVCPFIEQSAHESLENVAAATATYSRLKEELAPALKIALLHGKQTATEKDMLLKRLFNKDIDVLVTTPIVEVGMDLPQASAMVIEAAERFGLASLHQLRGRVGRAGQQGYCILFQSGSSAAGRERLKKFETIHNGRELAELDLQHRGAGDLFGTTQHGFDELQFASWTNVELIGLAQKISAELPHDWQSVLFKKVTESAPAAN